MSNITALNTRMIKLLLLASGIIVGVLQAVLLGRITSAIIVKKQRIWVPLMLKIALYIIFILLIIFFIPYALYTAAGYGAGIILCSLITFLRR